MKALPDEYRAGIATGAPLPPLLSIQKCSDSHLVSLLVSVA